ncbi:MULTISPECIES: DUF1398 family protein [Dyadobacter]|jgi:uncharacterized protein YbcV (DUF1398 family)|uniref:DUF1398 domain-containing protein n=1 Tax=Dyadobacter chenhuakuii TaxID=2909339 RepID=A0A9X1QE71_9BACT|nr:MULTISPECIES: DUF1398 family protein [Dyadobacter]MCE7069625.1 DUF1398 domain-containing protein [Dyadobacter sp. CY327]MCF2491950.1 DUF1398 domain-containing protein [Dyadobacter chenhuakuii]MCF2498693.1 DUF1398 domain-containing protein [Dyadobacter chenhuakuii]MCF2516587.1 DUF1398 domain-containing protein [Dyadobacter sp. CY351]USJ28888.1 DUF1398 domain-containing protein [Dyadobacter chenhuakuii]
MHMVELTDDLIKSAEERSAGQAYPYFVKNLKAIGVDNYEIKVGNHRRTYTSVIGDKLVIEGDIPEFECAETFELEAVKTAIKRNQEGVTDYPTFLREIGAAGIHTYVADLAGMKVIYQGPNSEYEYEEAIPEV